VAACGSSATPGTNTSGSGSNSSTSSGDQGTLNQWTVGEFKLAERIAKKVKNGEKLMIRISYLDPSLAFAQPIKQGVLDAAKQLGVDAELVGPVGGGADKQVAELETLITRGVDGLAVASATTDALAPVINKALAAGIPVITFNTDNPASKRMAFIGQDLVASGLAAGEQLVKRMGTKGNVIVFTLDAAAQWSVDRVGGFKEHVSKYPDIKIVQVVNTGGEMTQAYGAVENAMRANPNVNGIYATDCCSTPAVGKWIEDNKKMNQYTFIGFDELDMQLQQVKTGSLNVTLGQNPYKQGFESVKMLHEFLTKGTEPKRSDTGVDVIDSSNIDQFLKK
jgi:simple sugar transport system substrate-binding protein